MPELRDELDILRMELEDCWQRVIGRDDKTRLLPLG
jgi:hypothetical protein